MLFDEPNGIFGHKGQISIHITRIIYARPSVAPLGRTTDKPDLDFWEGLDK